MKYVCQNCSKSWDSIDDLKEIEDLTLRVNPGEVMPAGECPDCCALCHAVKPKYNHAFTVAFTVDSEESNPEKVGRDALLAGITKRLTDLIGNGTEILEACEQFDVFEYDHQCKLCDDALGMEGLRKAHIHQEEWICDDCWNEHLASTA